MLFEPDRHEALAGPAWDAAAVRQAIQAIADDIAGHRLANGHWPLHPLDTDADVPAGGCKSLYWGQTKSRSTASSTANCQANKARACLMM